MSESFMFLSHHWAIWQQEEPNLCTGDRQGDKPVNVVVQKPGCAESAHSQTAAAPLNTDDIQKTKGVLSFKG